MAHKGAAHGHHLLLTAGKRAGQLAATFLQTREVVEHHLKILTQTGLVFETERAHLQVLLHAHAGEHVAAFRHMGHAQRDDLVRMRFEQIVAIIGNAAGFGRHQTGDGVQGGGLAGAVGSDQGDDLAVVHLEANALDRVDRAIGNA